MLAKHVPSRNCIDCGKPRGADVGACTCEKTIRVLKKIGAKHAAMMHERNAGGYSILDWTPMDWYMHMDEEERLLFRYFPSEVVALLLAHHRIFRRELAMYGRIMSTDLMTQHSRIEDDTVARLDLVTKLAA